MYIAIDSEKKSAAMKLNDINVINTALPHMPESFHKPIIIKTKRNNPTKPV